MDADEIRRKFVREGGARHGSTHFSRKRRQSFHDRDCNEKSFNYERRDTMVCKKRMKRCIARFMGLAMGLMFSMNAMAVTKETTLAGLTIRATSYVTEKSGFCSTTCAKYTLSATVKVKCIYTYIDPVTGDKGTMYSPDYPNWTEKGSSVEISFTAPKDNRSLSIQCDHAARYMEEDWFCSTVDSYYFP